jgi:hypothetical protein
VTEPGDELVRVLRQTAAPGENVDVEAALARVRSRAGVVQRRRAAMRGSAIVAGAVAVGTIWLATRPADQTHVDTISSPTSPTIPSTTLPTTPTTVATTVPPTPPTIAASAPVTNPLAPPLFPSPTTTPRAPSAPVSFRGVGGRITARVQGGGLQLVSVQPAAGYVVTELKVDSAEIEVRFEGDAGETRIKVRLEEGRISPEVEERTSGGDGGDHGGTAPEPSGDHGGGTSDEGQSGSVGSVDSGGGSGGRGGPGPG